MLNRDLQKLFSENGLGHCIRCDEPLSKYTTWGVGGIADVMVLPQTLEDIRKTYQLCYAQGITPKVIGGGSNLLALTRRIPVVVHLKQFRKVAIEDNSIQVQSGALLPVVVKRAVRHGLSGFESLVGIPGTIGGAIAGNAGSKPEGVSVEIGDFVDQVTVVTQEGQLLTLEKDQLVFNYRSSNLRNYIILDATLSSQRTESTVLLDRWKRFFHKKSQSQPFSEKSAGCVFRNPVDQPAWKLICDADLAGQKVGNAMVSTKHANFIVNIGDACAEEVWELINLIRGRVQNCFGVDLILEVQVW